LLTVKSITDCLEDEPNDGKEDVYVGPVSIKLGYWERHVNYDIYNTKFPTAAERQQYADLVKSYPFTSRENNVEQ
jgi:hypothetical protein